MLSLDPADLAAEIDRAEAFRRKHTNRIADIAARYVGNWYRNDQGCAATPENSVFAYVAYMLPELWYADPACRVKARRPLSDQPIADAMEAGLRAWLSEVDFTVEGQAAVRDAFFGYGVIQVGIEPRDTRDGKQQALRPFAAHLPMDQLILDPRCAGPLKARYIGHSYWIDIDDLRADPVTWDPTIVATIGTDGGNEYDEGNMERALPKAEVPNRKRVQLVDLWIPEHNKLVTLTRTAGGTTSQILRMVDYWGPPEGPYEIYGFYAVPDDPYPLSPLAPVMEQLEEMWLHQAQASEEAALYKRYILVEASARDVQKAIMESKSGGVYAVNGLTGKFAEVEQGGSPPGRLDHIMSLRDRADRTSGISDAQRGRVKNSTATEADVVQGNVDTRTSYLRGRVNWHTSRVLRRVGWYLFSDPSVVMPVSTVDPQTGQASEGTFLGGPQPGQEDKEWVDFTLDIDPQSMQHADDVMIQTRALDLLQMAEQLVQFMPMAPQVNWRYIVNTFGESFNQKELFTLLFNPMAQQPMLPQGMGAPGQPGMDPTGGAGGMGGSPMMSGGGAGMPPAGQPPAAPAPPPGPGGPMMKPAGPVSGGPRAPLPFAFIGKGKGKPTSGGPRSHSGMAKPHSSAGGSPSTGGPRAQAKRGKARPFGKGGFSGGPRANAGKSGGGGLPAPKFAGGPRAKAA